MNDIIRPTLILDKNVCLNNIEKNGRKKPKSITFASGPILKTHQSAKIGDWFKIYGVQFDYSNLPYKWLNIFSINGWDDITIAFSGKPYWRSKILTALASSVRLNVLVEKQRRDNRSGKKK